MTSKEPNKENGSKKPDLTKHVEKAFAISFDKLVWWFVVAILLAGIAFVFSDWSSDDGTTGRMGDAENATKSSGVSSVLAGLNKGEMAKFVINPSPVDIPKFTFVTEDGSKKSLQDFKGQVILMNIWATWCAPCRHEMPALDQLKSDLGKGGGFDVVTISIDRGGLDKPKNFFEQTGVKKLVLYGDPSGGRLGPQLRVVGMPTTLLIDPDGREIGRLTGPAEWASADAKNLIAAAIKANAPNQKSASITGQ